MDPKVVFSAKLLRKYTHLDEGDVCSACSLRNSCSRGYILTLKEDEARTLDVMRILLTYGFDHVNGAVENKPLMQMKSVITVVRKLLHEIVKLSAIPRDPNLPIPVIKKPPPKVKQPPPQPKKRIGRDDVEMKKGDWICPKCDFMNFAKNTVCMQCDANRPKRQLLPGEWECPQCNFLNYRRNMACFHCDAKRPPDEFTENQFQAKQAAPKMRLDRAPTRAQDISNAWNFDFDDNESDGADVAAFEFADSAKGGNITDLDDLPHVRTLESFENDKWNTSKIPRAHERSRDFSANNERKSTLHSDRTGFDDFDDEEDDDSYELDGSNNSQPSDVSKRSFSEIENSSVSEDLDDSEDDELADHPQLKSSHVVESWDKSGRRGHISSNSDDDVELDFDDDDDDDDMNSGFGSKHGKNLQPSLGREGIGRWRGDSDRQDDLLDSDSDGDDNISYLSRNKMRGNKGLSNRRGSDVRKSNDFHNARGEFRSDDRKKSNRRNSFSDQDNDFSCRGSRRDGYGGRRENNRFKHFDRLNDRIGRQDGFKGSTQEDSRFKHFVKSDDWKRQDRSYQFSDRPRGSRRDDRGTRGSGYNESSGHGGFRRERANNFRDRSRSFEDNSDGDRPRRRVIEG